MIIKCAIVDDEPLAVNLLASYVEKIPFLELCGKYNNATDALHGIGEQPAQPVESPFPAEHAEQHLCTHRL